MQVSRNARRVTSGRVAGVGMGKYVWVGGGLIALLCMQAIARPDGEQVVSGSATFQRNGGNTLITTGGPSTIIDYRSFNIGVNEAVRIQQPSADSRTLNRVPNSVMPTRIDGQLTSNGIVYIANASGVYFGQHAIVNAAGVYAAAGQITNQDFLNNINRFTSLSGDVVNQGSIVGGTSGVALLGKHVANSGNISAPDGLVALAAGESVYLTEVRGHMMVEVTGGDRAAAAHGRGDVAGPSRPGVENSGRIQARQTRLQSGDLYSLAIRMPGEIRSSDVVIRAGTEAPVSGNTNAARGGVVEVSGTIDASNHEASGVGGSVEILGDRVNLRGAEIDASGTAGGGTVKIGGDYQGGGGTLRARHTRVDADTTVRADAIESGDGGRVIVWSDQATRFAGDISVKGGANGGDGGFVEVSSHGYLGYVGNVDATAILGLPGTLLLDPTSITVVAGNGNMLDEVDMFGENPGASMLGVNRINNAAASANVILQATDFITFDAAVVMANAGTTLTAQAGNTITVNQPITTLGGFVTLEVNQTFMGTGAPAPDVVGIININAAITTNGGAITLRAAGDTGSSSAININADLSSGAGAIVLDFNSGTGGIVIGDADMVADTRSLLTDGGNVTITGGVVITDDVVIDTEQGDNSAAGAVNLSAATVTTNGFGLDLSINTSSAGAAAGAISVGTITGSSAGFLNNLTLNAGGATPAAITLAGNISLDGNGMDLGDLTVAGGSRIVVGAATVTIDTEQQGMSGSDGDAGDINFGGLPVSATAALFPVLNLNADVTNAGAAINGGDVLLGTFNNAGGGFVRQVNINTSGSTGSMPGTAGTATLSGNISLDSGGGNASLFSMSGGGALIIDAAALTIDTEDSNDGNAGAITLFAGPITTTAGRDALAVLNLNTATTFGTGTGGAISIGAVNDAGGGFLRQVNVTSGGGMMGATGLVTLSGLISVDSTDGTAQVSVSNGGLTVINANITIDTENGVAGPGGTIDLSGTTLTANAGSASRRTLALDTSSTNPGSDGGNVLLGGASADGGSALNDITINMAGGAGANNGTLAMAGTYSLDSNTALVDPSGFTVNNGAVLLTGNTTINTEVGGNDSAGDVTFGAGVTIDGAFALAINAIPASGTGPAGDITITAAAGGSAPLSSISLIGDEIAVDDVAVSGNALFRGNEVQLNGGAGSLVGNGGGSTLTVEPLAVGGTLSVGAVMTPEALAIGTAPIGTFAGGLFFGRTDGTGLINVGTATFANAVTIRSGGVGGSVILEANAMLSTAAANAAIVIQAGSGNAGLLTTDNGSSILAGGGAIELTADSINLLGGSGSISSTGTVTLQPTSAARPMVVGDVGGVGDFALGSAELLNVANGSAGILIGRTDSSGGMTIEAVTFQDPVTFRSPIGGSITVDGMITGTGNADIAFIGSGATTILNADIATAMDNDISFDDSVELGVSTVSLTVSGTGNIIFNEKINGTTAGAETLLINAGAMGQVIFLGRIGETVPLGQLTVVGGTVQLAGDADTVRTTGAAGGVNFTGVTTVRMESNVTIDTDAANGVDGAGDILFGNATITTPNGSVTLRFDACADGGGAGGVVTLGTVDAAGVMNNANSLTILGDSLTLNGDITTAGAVNFGDECINTTTLAAGTITINNTAGTDGAISLRNVGGDNTLVLVGDAASPISIVNADIDTLTLMSGGTLSLSGTIQTDTAQDYSNVSNIVLLAATTLTAQSDVMDPMTRQDITLDADNDVTGAFGLNVNGAAVSIDSIGQGAGADPTSLTISATNGVTLLDAQVGGIVGITATAGDVEIDELDAGTNNVTVVATTGAINETDLDTESDITGGVVQLTADTGIGSAFGGLETVSASLDLNTTNVGANIVVTELDAMGEMTTVTATTVGGDITIIDTMGDILLDVLNAGMGGTVTVTATAGSILDDVNDTAADIITTGATNLTASTGIGTGAGGAIDLDVATVTNASSDTGGVNLTILDADLSGTTITSASATTSGDIVVTTTAATGDVTVNGVNTNDGNILVAIADGNLIVGGAGVVADSGAGMDGTSDIILATTNGNINVNASITADTGSIVLAGNDLSIGAAITTLGDVTLSAADAGSIGVGNATVMPGLNIDNAELTNITAGNLTISTTGGDGDITIDGVTTSVDGISGLVKFLATGGDNQITFSGAASQFRSLSACSDNGIFIDSASIPFTTVGALTLDADTDNTADMGVNSDSIVFGAGVTALESAGDLTLLACNGMIVAPAGLSLESAGILTLGGAMSVGSLSLNSDNGLTITKNITSAGAIDINADANADGAGTLTVSMGAAVTANDAPITITAADIDITAGFINAGNALMTLNASVPINAQLGGLDAPGLFSISESEAPNFTANGFTVNVDGDVTIDGFIAFDPAGMLGTISGLFTVNAGGTIDITGAESFFDSLSLMGEDLNIGSGGSIIAVNDVTIGRGSVGSIGLGDATGAMTITGDELALIRAQNLTIGGANVTRIDVDNVIGTNTENISGTVTLDATRDDAVISFQGAASEFRRLTARADDGIAVDADVSTSVGDLRLEGDADNAMDTADSIAISDGRVLSAGIALILDATSGGIDGAGITNLVAVQGIVINDSLTSEGVLTINSDLNADGFGTLTFLTGTTNSTSNDNVSITAANVVINGTLNAGTGEISIVRSSAGAARLGGIDPGAGVLWVDNAELGRLTSVGFTFGGGLATLVEVDGVTTGGAPGITGTTRISALGTEGQVRFINNDSSFRTLNVQANDGVLVSRSLSTTQGIIEMNADANADIDTVDSIRLAESVNLNGASGIFLSASGGLQLDGAFGTSNTLTAGSDGDISVPILSAPSGSGITISAQGDVILIGGSIGAGTLIVTADSDNDGSNSLSSRGQIVRAGNVLFSGGGTGTGDTIELFFDVSSDGAIVLQNADTVTIGGSVDPEVNLTASNGSIDILSNIGVIRLDGDDATTNTFTNANGSMSFAPIVATNDSNLRFVSSGVASISTIDLNNGNFIADAGLSNVAANSASIEAMNITINREVTTQNSGTFTVVVNNNGVFTADPAAMFNLDGAFAQTEGAMSDATVNFAGSITTTNDNISFASPVRVRGTNVTMNTGVGTGNIAFMDTIDGQVAGVTDLTLIAGSGNVNFASSVGAGIDGLLDVLTIQSATNVTFTGAAFLNALVQTAGTGTTTFNSTLIAQGAQGIDLNGNIFVFNENVVTINGTNGGFALTNSGDATFVAGKSYQFEGAFIQDGVGRVLLGSGISTDNDAMSFAGPVVISNDMTLSTAGGAMSFSGTVNDSTAGMHNLRLDGGGTGDITFNTGSSVGVTSPFRSFRASGQDVSVREVRTAGGDITLLPLLTLTDVDTTADTGLGNIPGTLRGQDLRPSGVLTINGNLITTGGGVVRLAQSIDGGNIVDNNGHRLMDTVGISSVATIVFGDINLDNGAAGGTFLIDSSGDILFGQFEKVAVFGSLTLVTPGTVTLTDVSATNELRVTAGTIRFQSRPPAFLVDPTNLINGELNRMNPDNGPSIVARNAIVLSGLIATDGSDTVPTFGSTRSTDVTGATGFIPLSISNVQIPTPNRLRFADPSLGLTALTVNASGVGNFPLAAALAAALPRENRFEVSTDVTVGKAQREVLQAMQIYARDLTAEELQDFLTGRSFYNDAERGLAPDSVASDNEVTVNRLSPPLVERLVGPYLRVFYKPKTDPVTGEQRLTIDENGGERSRADVKDILTKALTRFMGDATGTPDPLAFRDYLENTPAEEEAFFIVQNLGEFLTELQLLGLGPREESNARKAVFNPIRPSKFTNPAQFEQLLLGEVEAVSAE